MIKRVFFFFMISVLGVGPSLSAGSEEGEASKCSINKDLRLNRDLKKDDSGDLIKRSTLSQYVFPKGAKELSKDDLFKIINILKEGLGFRGNGRISFESLPPPSDRESAVSGEIEVLFERFGFSLFLEQELLKTWVACNRKLLLSFKSLSMAEDVLWRSIPGKRYLEKLKGMLKAAKDSNI